VVSPPKMALFRRITFSRESRPQPNGDLPLAPYPNSPSVGKAAGATHYSYHKAIGRSVKTKIHADPGLARPPGTASSRAPG